MVEGVVRIKALYNWVQVLLSRTWKSRSVGKIHMSYVELAGVNFGS